MKLRFLIFPLFGASIAFLPTLRAENEIGFIERFALAADREKALGELVPGSEDYYFFHCLHYQSARNEAKFNEFMDQWRKRFPHENARRRIIENRQALLDYDATPQQTLDYLKRQLGVTHNDQKEVRDQKPQLPTTLDPKLVSRKVFERWALSNNQSIGGLTQDALETLVRNKTTLSLQQRRSLLSQLQRPDVPNLAELVIADLKTQESSGFGEFEIHRALLPDQLGTLVKAIPALATNDAFVQTRLRKLAPSPDVDIAFDADEREAWLDRVWNYAKSLPPAFNTIKARILYQRLDHDRMKGVYDKARFIEYLKLPRSLSYVNPKWLEKTADAGIPQVNLDADLSAGLVINRPISNDEALIREYFLALFDQEAKANVAGLGEKMMAPYIDYVRDSWLRPLLAEALIVGGHGNAERWASLLNPVAFQQLKDRVDIEFPSTNPQFFQPGDAAEFDVVVKNTPKLMVRIYELNTLNFFLTQKRQLNTDLNLDGLVANTEQTHSFDTGPFKRTRQTFKFPELKGKRGAWIVEFIGTGRSSRALVRIGQWQVIQQTGPAGDLLLVVDEKSQPVKDAVAWLDGRRLTRDEKLGRIVVPFSNRPGMRPLVVSDPAGTFATLTQFEQHAENYQLDARFHIEREQLLARHEATLAVRTLLMLGESQLDPALISEPKLTITSTTLDGISTTREVKNLKLGAGAELTHAISVPERLAQLTVTLSGKVEMLSAGGEKRDVSASQTWNLNGIDKTDATNDGHLSNFNGERVFEMLGKNGEPVADQQVVFNFLYRGFSNPQTIPLKTDEKGRIALGKLPGIAVVSSQIPNGRTSQWDLDDAERTWTSEVHAAAGGVVRLPWPDRSLPVTPGAAQNPQLELSLLETRAGTFTEDLVGKISVKDGFVEITGLPPGDYSLKMRGDDRMISIQIGEGEQVGGWLLGKRRNLEIKGTSVLQITDITADKDVVEVKLAHANEFTRVHIAASRFDPGKGIFAGLGGFTRFGAASGSPAKNPNLFSAGRAIGDEYRYILERKFGKIYPGNMLTRPGLLLNPWEIRDTGLDELALAAMQQAGSTRGDRREARGAARAEAAMDRDSRGLGGAAAETNLDFLADSAPAIYNLLPDKDGVVRIDRKALRDRQHVQVYAEDLSNAAWQSFALPEVPTKFTDLRLARNLDPAKPFTQRKEITVLGKGKILTLEDILTSEMESYDTLGSVHALFTTLSGDANLAKFAWVLQWPTLKDDEKLAKYSEFACHELNYFLARKDAAFFAKVIKPSLANKKDKTFMDDFLLENDLSSYLQSSAYARLNVVERALLGQRVKGEAANAARSLREMWEMAPPNPELLDRLFETALRGRALETNEGKPGWNGVLEGEKGKAREEANRSLEKMDRSADAFAPATAAAPMAELSSLNGISKKMKGGFARTAPEDEMLADAPKEELDGAELGMDQAAFRDAVTESKDRQYRLSSASGEISNGKDAFFGKDASAAVRAQSRAYYRLLGPTKEWAENNYYHLRIVQQDGNLIPVSAFWRDYAAWVGDGAQGAFVSPNVAEASHNFAEMMLALAVLDLPFDAPKHDGKAAEGKFNLTAGGPVIVFHKEIKPAAPLAPKAQQGLLLVSQSFFRASDRYRMEGNEKFEKYVTEEFLTGVVYGANVVVTNPASAPVKAEVLLQIPQGALPVIGSKATNSKSVRLEPYTTKTFEYYFYFPATAGAKKFPHFPVNVAVGGTVAGAAKPFEFNVVDKLTQFDKASWDYISQYGTADEVFAFLQQNNLAAIAFPRVAWRCHDAKFFNKLTAFMGTHHVWDGKIYSYALLHNDPNALREWILHRNDFVAQVGPYFSSKLVTIDPVERRAYEHLEYSPLVNQRAHRVGSERRIANPAVLGEYQGLLNILAHKPVLDGADSMSVTYYLFLQDRVDEALTRFHGVDAGTLPTRLQHDYFRCYAGFYESALAEARGVASQYSDYPVARWKLLFADVISQLDEIEGKPSKIEKGDKPDREKQQTELAATEPSFDFKVENRTIELTYRNLGEVAINYYLMDPEFSFSSSPFVSQDAGRFSIIKPNKTATQALVKDKDSVAVPLPAEFAKANVLVEIVAAGQRKAQAYHANTLKLNVTENYGRLEARDSADNHAVAKAYVKVYAKLDNGTVRFFKDGYTDLRGRFDYASLNGGAPSEPVPMPQERFAAPANGLDYQMLKPAELQRIGKFAILILSESNGATTREVDPPKE